MKFAVADISDCRVLTVRRRGECGFTLAELLVAVTLLSVVMTSVYSLTHSATRTWSSLERGQDIQVEARSFMTLFAHEYNNIVGRASHLFEGDTNSIVMFVTAQPMDLEQGEGSRLMRVSYSYNRSHRSIEREEALVEAALPMPQPDEHGIDRERIKLSRSHKTTVAEHVRRFRLRYVWAPMPEEIPPDVPPVPEPLIFMEHKHELLGLPQAVEITLVLRDPDDASNEFTLTTMLPMRAPSSRRYRHAFEELLDGSV